MQPVWRTVRSFTQKREELAYEADVPLLGILLYVQYKTKSGSEKQPGSAIVWGWGDEGHRDRLVKGHRLGTVRRIRSPELL